MSDKIEVEIKLYGESLETIKGNAENVFQHIRRASSFKQIPIAAGGGGPGWAFSVTCKLPIEARIKSLREEADRLEKSL